jgi:hypothetical protein
MSHWFHTRRVFFLLVALGLFALASREVSDPDLWWHLRTGQLVAQNHQVFRADQYSFTRAGAPWVNHEWLADLLMFEIYQAANWGGLIVFFGAVTAAAFLLTMLRGDGLPYVAGALTVWGAIASVPVMGVRPQMLSLLLCVLLLFLLEASQEHPRRLWWTIPILWLWVNLHASYVLGLALLVLFLLGTGLDGLSGRMPAAQAGSRLRHLSAALLLGLAVVPFNPYGTRMYAYPWETLFSPAMQRYIHEWASPNFHDRHYWPLLLLVLISYLVVWVSPRRLRGSELLLLAAGTGIALNAVRHIPIYVVMTIPLLSRQLQAWLDQRGAQRWLRSSPSPPARLKLLVNIVIVLGVTLFAAVRVRHVITQQPKTEARAFPQAAVSFLKARQPDGPMLNHYDWGGYLIWRLYSIYPVYVDGRADLYGDAFLHDLASTYYVRNHGEQALQHWNIQLVLLPPDAPLVTALRANSSWSEIYSDSQAVVLQKKR